MTGIPLDDELDELLLDDDELELDEDELLEDELELLELDELEITTPDDELELELDEAALLDEELELDELATTPLELDEELEEVPLELVDELPELDELELETGGGLELPPEFLLLLESHACSNTLAQSKPTLNKVPLEWGPIM